MELLLGRWSGRPAVTITLATGRGVRGGAFLHRSLDPLRTWRSPAGPTSEQTLVRATCHDMVTALASLRALLQHVPDSTEGSYDQAVHLDLDTGSLGLRVTDARVQRILVNLLENAHRHGAGHPVHLAVRTHPGRVRLCLTQQGVPDRVAAHLSTRIPPCDLTGLGLWVGATSGGRAARARGVRGRGGEDLHHRRPARPLTSPAARHVQRDGPRQPQPRSGEVV